ncbi:MAG: sialidase family protein, partial [Pirellulaceae bacterium]|nr:sialidase family protein [Pirellulaceae bacterium]
RETKGVANGACIFSDDGGDTHRVPSTSLHYSLDECKSWSENALIDGVGGAYPSMVNLKDGTVLVVYYEEGGGSNIRAKRFRATRDGVEWLSPE